MNFKLNPIKIRFSYLCVTPSFYIVDLVIEEPYRSEVNNEYVIRGNSVVLKCSIPPFIADFVTIVSWQDNRGNVYEPSLIEENPVNLLNNDGILI